MTRAVASSWRRGLGFSDEVAVLTWLRIGGRVGAGGLPAGVRAALPNATVERERVAWELYRDLVAAPAPAVRHAEWLDVSRARLPADSRAALGDGERLASASLWLRARWPCVSGRHRSSTEPARLALLGASRGEEVRAAATRGALLLLLRALGSRQRLALLSALGGTGSADRVELRAAAEEPSTDTLRLLTVESFRAAFARAAATAQSEAHLLDRFGTFVLANALGPGQCVEARALAESMPLKSGRRLLRYHRRAARSPRGLVDDARRVVEAALLQAASDLIAVTEEPS